MEAAEKRPGRPVGTIQARFHCPCPPRQTPARSLIRGAHAGGTHLSSPAEDTLSHSQGEVTGSRVQMPLLQPWAVQASAQLEEYSEKTLKLTEAIGPGTSPKKCLRGHSV